MFHYKGEKKQSRGLQPIKTFNEQLQELQLVSSLQIKWQEPLCFIPHISLNEREMHMEPECAALFCLQWSAPHYHLWCVLLFHYIGLILLSVPLTKVLAKRTGVGPRALHCGCPLLLVCVYRMGQMQRINFPTGISNKVLKRKTKKTHLLQYLLNNIPEGRAVTFVLRRDIDLNCFDTN